MRVPDTLSGYLEPYEASEKLLRRPGPHAARTVTELHLDDSFDIGTTATQGFGSDQVWENGTIGSAYDAFEYARRHDSFNNIFASDDGKRRRNSESLLITAARTRTGSLREVVSAERRGGIRRIVGDGSESGDSNSIVFEVGLGRRQLVEHRVLEDGPTRTITVWREQVASSSADNVTSRTQSSPGRNGTHQRSLSGNLSLINVHSARAPEYIGRSVSRNLPRSPLQRGFGETPLQHPSVSDHDKGRFSPNVQQVAMSPRVKAATLKIARNVSPPMSRGSGRRGANDNYNLGSPKATVTSTLELLLSSCQPSLIHLSHKFEELGIRMEEHLRAIIRMNDETRDREVKEEALKTGVTVVEWAIFLDKLRNLYSYDDMYQPN